MRTLLLFAFLVASAAHAQSFRVPPELKAKFPDLTIDPKVATKRDQDLKKSSYMQTMTITPQLNVNSAALLKMEALKATMIVIAMDTRAKYVDRKESYKVLSAETIVIPAVERGSRRFFEFGSSKTTFDSWRDSSNLGGMVYKWYLFGLHEAETGKLMYFETNCPSLTKHLNTKPDEKDKFLALKLGAAFPSKFP